MKVLSMLLVLVTVVAVVAVRGSSATPVDATSVAFKHCALARVSPDRCRSGWVMSVMADEFDGSNAIGSAAGAHEGQGGDLATPDAWREFLSAFAAGLGTVLGQELARLSIEFAASNEQTVPSRDGLTTATLFDPIK